jgi:hypothetical protein
VRKDVDKTCEYPKLGFVEGNAVSKLNSMENEQQSQEQGHWMQCPDCGKDFDMRDLGAVFDHQHWINEKPSVHFSHVTMRGKLTEVYVKVREKIVTLRLAAK